MARIQVNVGLSRSRIGTTRRLVNTELARDIARYRQLAQRLSRSRGNFRNEYRQALVAEAQALESIRRVYASTLSYLDNATTSVENQDRTIARTISRVGKS